jgi:hypothetical protein
MRKKFLRTKYLTGSRMQMHYLGLLLACMIIPLVVSVGCLYYLIFKMMERQLGIPEYIFYNLMPVVKKINFVLLWGVPPLFILLILWGIVLSHRFAGPLERLERELRRIIDEGHYRSRIRVRKQDDLKPIADTVNNLLDKLEVRHK